MKASELKPGQFFEFVDHPERYRAMNGRHLLNGESRVYFADRHHNLSWCANDLEVNADVPQGWDDEPKQSIDGAWPKDCLQRAFVEGAKWWEYQSTSATMWQSDRNLAEEEAVKRYGQPITEAPPVAKPEPEQFAAGDWLYCIESHAPLVAGKVYKVLAVKRDGWPEVEEGQGYWNPKYFRRATADEIAANKPVDLEATSKAIAEVAAMTDKWPAWKRNALGEMPPQSTGPIPEGQACIMDLKTGAKRFVSFTEVFPDYKGKDADGWIEWKGDSYRCPFELPATVETKSRLDEVTKWSLNYWDRHTWAHYGHSDDIIAYRLVNPPELTWTLTT